MKPITLADIHPERVDDYRWRLPRTGPMRVDGMVYADESLFSAIRNDQALVQVKALGARVVQPRAEFRWGPRALVEDPDGRTVEVFERPLTP